MPTVRLAASSARQFNAVVVSAGLMQKTVKARIGVQKMNQFLGKKFNKSTNVLVHDPNSSLRTGDVVSISNGWRTSKRVHHVVNHIIAPYGDPIEERPPVPTQEERFVAVEERKRVKDERRNARRAAAHAAAVAEGENGGEKIAAVEGEGVEGKIEA